MIKIHPSAVISKDAVIDDSVEVGPYAVIGPHVSIGAGTRVFSHAVIEGYTKIGKNCTIFPGACIGTPPQDKKVKESKSHIEIGDENVIREYVTVNAGSSPESKTVIGRGNFIMVGAHVAHDCVLGDDIVMANYTALSGHVVIEDKVVISGMVAVHQFTRIGKLSIIGGLGRVVKDIPPFSLCVGYHVRVYGVNSVGLKRAGYSSKETMAIRKALKILLTPGASLAERLKIIRHDFHGNADVGHLASFVEQSKRGVTAFSLSPLDEGQ